MAHIRDTAPVICRGFVIFKVRHAKKPQRRAPRRAATPWLRMRSHAGERGSRPTGVAPHGGAGQYQASVFNFVPSWDQFILASIATAPPRGQFPGRLTRNFCMRLSRHVWRKAARLRTRRGDSDSVNHGSNPGPSARESASNRGVFVVSSLAGIVLKLPRVSSPANASATTRDAKCLGAGRERPQGLSRPFSSRRMWSVSPGF
jgi:hypothetical protein